MDHSVRLKLREVRGQYQWKPETEDKAGFLRKRQDKFAEYQAWVKENNRLPKQTAPKGSEEKKIATWAYSIVHYHPHSKLAVQLRKMKEEYPKN